MFAWGWVGAHLTPLTLALQLPFIARSLCGTGSGCRVRPHPQYAVAALPSRADP